MPGGCIIVQKLTLGLKNMPELCGKGMAKAQSGSTHAMVSCLGLSYACLCEIHVHVASGVRKNFQVGSCKTAQGEHVEKPLLVQAEIMFSVENKKQRG